ncbi:Protein TIC 40, chloroplastic [Melia azedarach]|uniref:Protein TIC 40, chloroplastic n=1 Tax=Melia azedarach TaxID=155640 RepID=A0ACC1X6V0_MELAZ|nr:Protein TIC 40, chloroplastic [Melia azedarach]
MENLNMALVSSTSPKLVLNYTDFKNPTKGINGPRRNSSFVLPFTLSTSRIAFRTSRISVCARAGLRRISQDGKMGADGFASLTSGTGEQTTSVGVNPNYSMPPSSSNIGSPLFWVGVGVGLSVVFSFVASRLKQYAMQQAFKTMMNQMNTQNNQFSNAAFSPGTPFPFPTPPASWPTASRPAASQPTVTVDVPATKVEAASATDVKGTTEVKDETKLKDETKGEKVKEEPKKYAFIDVSPEESMPKSPFDNFEDVTSTSPSKDAQPPKEATQNGAAFKYGVSDSQGPQSTWTGNTGSGMTVETLEKLMEDPNVQKMIYPSLPEEMRNPATFKWMLQNPEYRQQLQEMLNNMSGSGEWDSRVMDTLKNFDITSPEVKQQFDQIGLTPEEVMSKIMANPDVALAFQNPKVQAAIMDCSQNPMSILKYQNDKEVMDVFNKISELFPGVNGSP